jgi:diguanylate cyclase (GGDEF)-like protein/PAS domain S-box-containing protein
LSNHLRILIVEDLAHDAELMLRELQRAGISFDAQRVDTAVDYRRELAEFQPDVILSDFTMPSFDGMEVLRIASQSYPYIPFIFVSGTLNEEDAVRALKSGATDYILKNNLLRLPAAVERAKKETEERHARQVLERQLRESEKRYRGLFESNPHPMWVYDIETLRFLAVNDTAVARYGFSHEEFLAMTIKDMRPEKDLPRLLDYLEKPLPMVNKPEIWQHRTKSGELVDVEIASHDLVSEGRPARIVVAYDVTERIQQQEKIARLSRVQALLSGINSAIVRTHDRQALFEEACRIAVEAGGFRMSLIAIRDRSAMKIVPVASAGKDEELMTAIKGILSSSEGAPNTMVARAMREKKAVVSNESQSDPQVLFGKKYAESGVRSMVILPLIVADEAVGVLALYAGEIEFFHEEEMKLLTELTGDIAYAIDHIDKQERLDYLAYYDALTGLPNRSLFFDRLAHQLGTATREGLTVALVILDLDRFRLINDTLGRQAGDALLKSVAKRIQDTLRDQDTVARVSSNGFAVAISSWGLADIAHVVEFRNKAVFERPFLLGQEQLRVTATAGVALFPDDGDNPETLFANAEAALRDAKVQNARLQFYSPQMNARVADSLRMENRLRRALESGELVLWYQPRVSIGTRRITGFEALMRWQDPESTLMVPPAQFIPLMEQTGLILDAGRWALSQVARDCRTWSANGIKPPRIAVNVSPIQLRQKDFVATVVEAAQRTEEAGASLDLEITESTIMENVESIIPVLQTLRGLGIEIAVDDFGTGYSSLAYIARLPIHDLKIDRSFVVGMTEREDSLAIVRSVISLAHSLKLIVVAEGVETEEQAALLLQLGCDQMQGYLFSRPVPPQQVPELLRQQNQMARVDLAENGSGITKKNRGRTKSAKRR